MNRCLTPAHHGFNWQGVEHNALGPTGIPMHLPLATVLIGQGIAWFTRRSSKDVGLQLVYHCHIQCGIFASRPVWAQDIHWSLAPPPHTTAREPDAKLLRIQNNLECKITQNGKQLKNY
jgi:hypothetical protein